MQSSDRFSRSPNLVAFDPESGSGVCSVHGKVALRSRQRKSGIIYYNCRTCERGTAPRKPESPQVKAERNRRWRANNPERVRQINRRARVKANGKRFGWDADMDELRYEEMLREQGGVCAICSEPPAEQKSLAIDHDHVSGSIRGLLCTVCNWALGRFNDDADRFERASAYLRR